MIDGLTIAMIVVAIILCAIVAWLYLKHQNKKPLEVKIKQEYAPDNQELLPPYRSVEKKTITKPTKPFHPEILTDYKINTRMGTTFKGNAKSPEKIQEEQRKRDWNN